MDKGQNRLALSQQTVRVLKLDRDDCNFEISVGIRATPLDIIVLLGTLGLWLYILSLYL